MKVLFCTDVTCDRKNEQVCGDELIDRTLSAEQEKALDDSMNLMQVIGKESEPPAIINWIGIAAITGAMFSAMFLLMALSELSLKELWQELYWMVYIFAGCAVVSVIYGLIYATKVRHSLQDERIQADIERVNSVQNECYAALGASEDSPFVDILCGKYLIKNGEIKIKQISNGIYFNPLAMKAFVADDALCLAVLNTRWAIPISGIKEIHKISKRVAMGGWNKEIRYNKAEYKQYKMALASGGGIILPYYYAISFEKDGEEYQMYFPPYELPVFEELTGMKAQ